MNTYTYAMCIFMCILMAIIVVLISVSFLLILINAFNEVRRNKTCKTHKIRWEQYTVNRETIKVKYFTDKIDKLSYIDEKSDWIDLRAAEDVVLKNGEFKLIPLGIAMELPTGYETHIVPRSSTFKNFGIIQTNHMWIIDESYCGDEDQWYMPVYALRDT